MCALREHAVWVTINLVILLALGAATLRWHQLGGGSSAQGMIANGLDRCVTIDIEGQTLEEVIDALRDATGTPVSLCGRLAVAGPFNIDGDGQRGLSLRVSDVKLRTALGLLVARIGERVRCRVEYDVADDGRILVGLEDELPRVARVYDLGDLPRRLFPDAHSPSPDEQFRDLVTDAIETSDWTGNGGTSAAIWCGGGKLAVVHRRRVQREVQNLLRQLRQAADRGERAPPAVAFQTP